MTKEREFNEMCSEVKDLTAIAGIAEQFKKLIEVLK